MQIWMNTISDKFPCRKWMFVHEWLSTGGDSPVYWRTPLPVFFFALIGTTLQNPPWPTSQLFIYRNNPLTLTFSLHSNSLFEPEITIWPRYFNPNYRLTPRLNSSSFHRDRHIHAPFNCFMHKLSTCLFFRPLCPNRCFSVRKMKNVLVYIIFILLFSS